MSKIHLIAIGGAVMHNVALALLENGHEVSGSDDQIYEPARSRLAAAGILPQQDGWFPDRIPLDVDFAILGMHAKADNPELQFLLEKKIKVYSFPEYVAMEMKDKQKVVIAGSHGKTTTTSIIMHILKNSQVDFDYLVGAQIDGFKNMVSFSNAPIAVIEGDEYLSSALDPRPKFLHYKPQIVIITGIAWDHYNVFPTIAHYTQAFASFLDTMDDGVRVFYDGGDEALCSLMKAYESRLHCVSYGACEYVVENENYYGGKNKTPLQIFGKHNMQNISAALHVVESLGVNPDHAMATLVSFRGAAKRQEEIYNPNGKKIYRDFAHAPSKVKATLEAFREKYPTKKIAAFLELHTYSSLNKDFLPEYHHSVDTLDELIVYYDQKALEIKRMPMIYDQDIKDAFGLATMHVCTEQNKVQDLIRDKFKDAEVILFLGSGNFGGINLAEFSMEL